MLGAVARAAEAILRACPEVVILATSREPLRAEGENLQRLQPLSMPPPGQPIGAAELDAQLKAVHAEKVRVEDEWLAATELAES